MVNLSSPGNCEFRKENLYSSFTFQHPDEPSRDLWGPEIRELVLEELKTKELNTCIFTPVKGILKMSNLFIPNTLDI